MRGFLYFGIFLLIVFGILYVLTGWSYSDGERAGTISKFSRRGYVFKTYEGVLNIGGFSGETGSLTPQYFDFSVSDDVIATQVTQAVKTGQRVTLHYEEKLFRLPWNGDTKYYITSVETVTTGRPYGDASGFPGYQQGAPAPSQQQVAPQTAPQQPALTPEQSTTASTPL